MRHDDIIHITAGSRDIRIHHGILIFLDPGFSFSCRIFGILDGSGKNDVGCTLSAHDGDFGIRPGVDEVCPQVLGAHADVGTAVSLAGNQRDLRYGRFTVGKQHLGPVPDDAAVFLGRARQEARDIFQGQQRNIEGITGPDETAGLVTGVDIQNTCHGFRLGSDDTDAAAVEADVAGDDIRRKVSLVFEEFAVVSDRTDNIVHVICLVRILRDNRVEHLVFPVKVIRTGILRRGFVVVLRQESQQRADFLQAGIFIGTGEVGAAGDPVVRHGTAEGFCGNFFTGNGLDDLRTGDKHFTGALHHEDEIGDGRGIHRTAGTRAHDDGNLRNDTARHRVVVEDAAIAGQGVNAFLNPGTAGVIDADHRAADLHGRFLGRRDLLRMHFTQRTADDREVLCGGIGHTAVDQAVAGHNTVPGRFFFLHAEIDTAVFHEQAGFDKGVRIKQSFEPFPGCILALAVLSVDGLLTAAQTQLCFPVQHFLLLNSSHRFLSYFLKLAGTSYSPPEISASSSRVLAASISLLARAGSISRSSG